MTLRSNSRQDRAVAVSIPCPTAVEDCFFMRERLIAVRDTLIVLALQIVFRVTMFFRHLNY